MTRAYGIKQRLVTKSAPIFEVLGTLDELNAAVGISREYCDKKFDKGRSQLDSIQIAISDIGFYFMTFRESDPLLLDKERVKELEIWIDELYDHPLFRCMHLVLPSGGLASAHLHHARAVCRRCEREVIRFLLEMEGPNYLARHPGSEAIVQYLNRLSDYMFMLARYMCKVQGEKELHYTKKFSP